MSENEGHAAGVDQYEVVVGFAGSSRTVVEMVDAKDRGEAGRKARDEHGITAISMEVLQL